tara:strand:- start:835 stop:1077 length:243 start_codon:yes stop_codon:yes gene_type:complete
MPELAQSDGQPFCDDYASVPPVQAADAELDELAALQIRSMRKVRRRRDQRSQFRLFFRDLNNMRVQPSLSLPLNTAPTEV